MYPRSVYTTILLITSYQANVKWSKMRERGLTVSLSKIGKNFSQQNEFLELGLSCYCIVLDLCFLANCIAALI